ncbi:hypothetical protein B5E41_27285 [Rhizobium esperanzae]|uniref:Uncharacterized protein n=1 Tax=Rhizobium esperanzae TaxID=1967781 RepID=A0A246DPT5_9HYPH|nr:hypothetical protein B5E41_27285 [Rhizobium esperanzae]
MQLKIKEHGDDAPGRVHFNGRASASAQTRLLFFALLALISPLRCAASANDRRRSRAVLAL